MESFGLMCDISENELLDVWDSDLPTNSMAHADPFRSSSPMDSLIQSGQTSLWPLPEVIKNDKLLTDDNGFGANFQMSSNCSSSSVSSSASTASSSSPSPPSANGMPVKEEMPNGTFGSDGDSMPDSPMSFSEEASNLSLMNFGTKAEANLAGFSLKEEPLSPLANGHDDLSINVVDSDSNGSNSHSPGLRTSLNPKRKRKGEAPQQVISGLISTSTPNFGYVIKQEGGGTTTFAPQQLKICTTQSLLKPSTIVLTAKGHGTNRLVIPNVNIKLDPHGLVSSATSSTTTSPTSSSSADSDLIPGPAVPAQSVTPSNRPHKSGRSGRMSYSQSGGRQPITTPLISSQPKGSTGPLLLTDEEKRTLLSEGYPVPQRLPLSKQEEKSLKKIRRKIKNKISAQESRRKKKEYMDCLEKKMENLHDELSQYKARCAALESQNVSLTNQVKKLQAQLTPVTHQPTTAVSSSCTNKLIRDDVKLTTVTVLAKPSTRASINK